MALCVYHETTDAVATCPVCKQGICDKCLEFGQDGMCGMCVEMAAARKASADASRAARAQAGPAPAQPARPAARPPAPPKTAGAPAGARSPSGAMGAPSKPAARPGMCAEHPDQAAKSTCTHCNKKVCPYCLDLYDLCSDCRQLPTCVRHESMVGADRCAGCKMAFCKICLDGTDYCDRCRTLRQASGQSVKKAVTSPGGPRTGTGAQGKGGTGSLKPPGAPAGGPARTPTGSLQRTPTGSLEGRGAAAQAAAVSPTRGSTDAKKGAPGKPGAKAASGKKVGGVPVPAIAGGVLVVLALGWHFMGGGKPALSPDEATSALRSEMAMVQHAAVAVEADSGAYPSTSEALLAEMKKEGIDVGALPLALKLTVNTDPTEAFGIVYKVVGQSFEIRALDGEGRPFADNGRDVVLRPPPTRERKAHEQEG